MDRTVGHTKCGAQKKRNSFSKCLFCCEHSILLRFVNFKKMAFAELSDKTNNMSKINVRLIGTAQWQQEEDFSFFRVLHFLSTTVRSP